MTRFIAAIALTVMVQPALAYDRMDRQTCQATVEQVLDMAGSNDEDRAEVIRSIRVTIDKWCQIRAVDPGFRDDDLPFTELEWRMDGAARWAEQGIPPLAIQVRARGLDPDEMEGGGANTNRPPLDAELTLRQEPDAGQLLLETFVMKNGAGDVMSVSGVFEGVYLSSTSMMQVSMGSATFKAGLFSMTMGGDVDDPFAMYGNVDISVTGDATALVEDTLEGISSLPEGVIDDTSRAELMAYAAELPDPVGTLEVSVASERGLGLMQVGMAMYTSFESAFDEDADMASEAAKMMEILLDGVTVQATWSAVD